MADEKDRFDRLLKAMVSGRPPRSEKPPSKENAEARKQKGER